MIRIEAPRHFLLWSALVLSAALLGSLASDSFANPKNIPAGARKVYQFNIVGYPAGQEYTGNCGNGNRLFVNREANHAKVNVTDGTSWDITDCNATSDNQGELTTSDVGSYMVFTRILGKPGGHIRICADSYIDPVTGEELCLLGFLDLTRTNGQSKFDVAPNSLFDASVEDILWSVDTNADFRIAQFRIYQVP